MLCCLLTLKRPVSSMDKTVPPENKLLNEAKIDALHEIELCFINNIPSEPFLVSAGRISFSGLFPRCTEKTILFYFFRCLGIIHKSTHTHTHTRKKELMFVNSFIIITIELFAKAKSIIRALFFIFIIIIILNYIFRLVRSLASRCK